MMLSFVTTLSGCAFPSLSSSDGEETSTTNQYLIIPNASWYSDSVSYSQSQGGGSFPTVTVSEGDQVLTVGTSVTWEVNFEAIVEVEADESFIIVTSEDFDGYFTYPITEDDIQNGFVEIEMELEESIPSEAVCNRDYLGNGTCYEQVDSGVTGADFAVVNNIAGEMTLTASIEVELTVSETTDFADDSTDTEGSEDSSGTSTDSYCSDWVSYCSCNLRACSDGTNSWYDVGSGVYYCSGSDCTSAAQQAVQWCTSGC